MVKYGQQCRLLTPLSAYCLSVLIVHGWQDMGSDIVSPELKADNKWKCAPDKAKQRVRDS
jgi:hypothetical protein